MRPASPPAIVTAPGLGNVFGGPEFGDPARDGSSGSATPPTPSPDTPASAQKDTSFNAKVVIDVDEYNDLYDAGEIALRAVAERTNAVAKGWRERWAMGSTSSLSSSASFSSGQKSKGSSDPKTKKGKKKPSLSPSDFKRSNTNVTPAGLHSLRQPRVSFPGSGVKSKGKGKVTPATKFFQTKVASLKSREPIVIDDLSDEDDEIMIGSSPPPPEKTLDRFR
jgi:exonuclease-1